jgi:hypothetical protein
VIEVDGHYDGENSWISDDGRFRAIRLSPSGRRWIVVGPDGRWSRSFMDLDAARLAMGEALKKNQAAAGLISGG